jgi:hypothetical protein
MAAAPDGAVRALASLRRDDDALASLCQRHEVLLLTAFGSTVAGATAPGDLDLGVLFVRSAPADLLGLLDGLVALTGYDGFDVVDLGRAGPVIRERAMVGADILYEREPGTWARESTAAMLERMDTDWLRRLSLEAMAG